MKQAVAAEKKKLGFSGKLTFPNAAALHGKLADALREESVEISFGEVEEVDISFLQLLCAALRTAEGASREVTVADDPVPPSVSELVETAGMVSPLGRREDGFWCRLAGRVAACG
jgi:ABC-type transporter Mla MlaB component